MTTPLQPGPTGTPLPAGEVVFRLLRTSKDGKALETHFALSDEDRQALLPSLSVWAEALTTPEEAQAFLGENQPVYQLYCRLGVEAVRTLTLPELPRPVLDIVWDTIFQKGTSLPDVRPGAQGHAGITGLLRPPGMEKSIYKKLWVRLTDLANEDLHAFLANEDLHALSEPS